MLRGMSGGTDPGTVPDVVRASAGRWPVLRTRNAKLLLATRMAGQGADGLLQAALGSFVLFSPERQATAAQVAGTFAVLLIPYSLVGPFAGVFLDRWSRVRVLVVANLVRAGVMIGVASLVANGRDGLDLGAAVLVAMGCARLVLAGLSAALPHAVAAEHLVTGNALFPVAGTLASATLTVTGLVLMPRLGPDGATALVLLVAVALVVAAGLAGRMPATALGPDEDDPARTRRLTTDIVAIAEGMVAGLRHIHDHPAARRALAVVVIHRFVFGAMLIDVLLIVRVTLHSPQAAEAALGDFALAAGSASVAALLAAVATPRVAARWGVTRWAAATMIPAALFLPCYLRGHDLAMLMAGSFLMGFSGQAVKIAGDTVLQQQVDDDFRGRVFSLYDVALNIALVGGIVLTAWAVPGSGLSPGLWLGLAVLLLATAAWSVRPLRASG